MRDKTLLRQLQALPLDAKILMTKQRIREWYHHFHGDVCISFSGGKDSTVLAHLVHEEYPDVPLVFANTGLEYPEIQAFARKMGAEFVRPKMSFSEVISTYGYPLISKEVAEAIHYARRIVAKNPGSLDSPERERERVPQGSAEWRRVNLTNSLPIIARERVPCFARRRAEITGVRDDTERIAARENRMETSESQRTDARAIRASATHKIQAHNDQASRPARTADQCGVSDCKRTSRESTDVSIRPEDGSWGKTDWHEWRRKAIAGVEEGYTGNSQFNKKRWLPLCQETQFLISHYCCNVMKKGPMGIYQRKTHRYLYIGTMAEESRLRTQAWVRHGCNAFDCKKQTSQPMSFWTEQDVLQYIKREGLEICSVYGDIMAVDEYGFYYDLLPGIECRLKCTGCQRTGCVFCGFGINLEKGETRFQRLAKTHPKQYEYCMGGGQWVDNPKYDPSAPKMDGDWLNWNPKKIWVPSKEGLGMRKVFEDCNQIYGKDFIRFE